MLLLLLACRTQAEPALDALVLGEGPDLVVGVHGRGHHAEGFQGVVAPPDGARLVLPNAPTAYGDGWTWFDGRSAEDILESERLLAQLIEAHDQGGRVTVFGFSQGGYLSLAVATQHPGLVDQAVAIGGDLPRELWPERAPSDSPDILVLHGEADTVIPIGPTRSTVEHLDRRGWKVTLETYPGVGHTIPDPMRERLEGALDPQ